jgi:hypothetical protein
MNQDDIDLAFRWLNCLGTNLMSTALVRLNIGKGGQQCGHVSGPYGIPAPSAARSMLRDAAHLRAYLEKVGKLDDSYWVLSLDELKHYGIEVE